MLDPKTLRDHPKNRNRHKKEQIERLVKLYKGLGVRHPIVVSKNSGYIVAGHGRKQAAIKAGMQKFPVVYQEFESDDVEYAFLQSDNAIALWSDLDLSGINADLVELDGSTFDIDLLGIEKFNLEVPELSMMDEELRDDLNKKFLLEITFPNDMEMMDIHDDLVSRGYIVKIK